MSYKQKLFPSVVAWTISIATFLFILFLSYVPPMVVTSQGVTSYTTYNNFDLPLGLATTLACLSLISTFRTKNPKRMYKGLYVYVLFFSLALCYVESANGRIMLFGLPALPVFYMSQNGLLFMLSATLILIIFRTHIIKLLSLITNQKREMELSEYYPEKPYFSYQQGYQTPKKPDIQKDVLRNERNEDFSTFYGEEYEKPQSSYPEDSQDISEQ